MQKESISWNMPGSFHLNRLWTAASVKAATASQLYTFTLTDSSFLLLLCKRNSQIKLWVRTPLLLGKFLSSHKCEWLLLLLLRWNVQICSGWGAVKGKTPVRDLQFYTHNPLLITLDHMKAYIISAKSAFCCISSLHSVLSFKTGCQNVKPVCLWCNFLFITQVTKYLCSKPLYIVHVLHVWSTVQRQVFQRPLNVRA